MARRKAVLVLATLAFTSLLLTQLYLLQMLRDTSLPEDQQEAVTSPPCLKVLVRSKPEEESVVNSTGAPEIVVMNRQAHIKLNRRMTELWWYLKANLKNTISPSQIDDVMEDVRDQYRLLLEQTEQLQNVSNEKYATEVGDLMQRRLQYLQNPPDCENAKKLVCRLTKTCGFGCQIHHVSYCLIIAYATERTLILKSNNWKYSHGGWESVFMPVSETCTTAPEGERWGMSNLDANTVFLPEIDGLSRANNIPYLPMAVPRDLHNKLKHFHGNHFAWFMGQLLKYFLRPNKDLQSFLDSKMERLRFKKPIVGVHVRRSDKVGTEANFHSIEEYMNQVEEWVVLRGGERRVYLATDEASLLKEAKLKYPDYEFISDEEIASKAGNLGTRYSLNSLYDVVFDVFMLSKCDYIVCTFSSQICRLAYEIMQAYHVDASMSYYSLDDIYYFGGQQSHNVRAIESHKKRNKKEISFKAGDLVGIAGNEKDGTSVGSVLHTSKIGIFPSYKVEDETLVADFPIYPAVL